MASRLCNEQTAPEEWPVPISDLQIYSMRCCCCLWAQVQLSGTDVVTGIDSPDQYQTNAYFKVCIHWSSAC